MVNTLGRAVAGSQRGHREQGTADFHGDPRPVRFLVSRTRRGRWERPTSTAAIKAMTAIIGGARLLDAPSTQPHPSELPV
jgi:hypothetical protein